MNRTLRQPVSIATIFIWIGFVCAISFMEAWLKFRAPGVTLPIGLGIGRLVFNALNTMEWIFAFVVVSHFALYRKYNSLFQLLMLSGVLAILCVQTWWLLPALDARAAMHIAGHTVPSAPLHFYFVGLEVLKVGFLFVSGALLLRSKP